MDVIHRYLDVVCKSTSGDEINFYAENYVECMDEIKITTQIRNSKLDRGWIGDLTYSTVRAYHIETGDETEVVAKSTYNDVLLASITIYSINDRYITWEYRFLKK